MLSSDWFNWGWCQLWPDHLFQVNQSLIVWFTPEGAWTQPNSTNVRPLTLNVTVMPHIIRHRLIALVVRKRHTHRCQPWHDEVIPGPFVYFSRSPSWEWRQSFVKISLTELSSQFDLTPLTVLGEGFSCSWPITCCIKATGWWFSAGIILTGDVPIPLVTELFLSSMPCRNVFQVRKYMLS